MTGVQFQSGMPEAPTQSFPIRQSNPIPIKPPQTQSDDRHPQGSEKRTLATTVHPTQTPPDTRCFSLFLPLFRFHRTPTMAPLVHASRACVRQLSRSGAPASARALSTTVARPDSTASYSSPFKGAQKGNEIPDFSKYVSKTPGPKNHLYSYFMVGALGAITAAGAKSTVQGTSSLGVVGRPLGVEGRCQSVRPPGGTNNQFSFPLVGCDAAVQLGCAGYG